MVALSEDVPSVPDEVLMEVVPEGCTSPEENQGERLPWNRRQRRRHKEAEVLVLHLFSGKDDKFWKKALDSEKVCVICVDKEIHSGMDMLDDGVMVYLVQLVLTGRGEGLCRRSTMSHGECMPLR